MTPINTKAFYRATNPAKTIDYQNPAERNYYIDLSEVRNLAVVDELEQSITWADEPTCQLFTGHIGCGKSTELIRLKTRLEDENFHVIYFDSSDVLEMGDVDVSDILLAIAQKIREDLQDLLTDKVSGYFSNFLGECAELLNTPIELSSATLNVGFARINTKLKENASLRSRMRQFVEPQTQGLIDAINTELIQPAIAALQNQGKEGLAIIVDSLDRIENKTHDSGKTLPEYLFISRGEQLSQLQCHMVYTIPLALMFSNEQATLKNRFGDASGMQVLPMVPVSDRHGNDYIDGLDKLRQVVLSRALPLASEADRLAAIPEIFDEPATLDRLCQASGGHVRHLLRFTRKSITRTLPITRDKVESVIQDECDDLVLAIDKDEWQLLADVANSKEVSGETNYQTLLRSLFVFEYRNGGRWFDVNPLIASAVRDRLAS